MQLTLWQKVRYLVLLLLIILITISSHPTIMQMSRSAGMTNGTILSKYIIVVFGVLFLMCINLRSMLKPKIVRVLWCLYALIAFYYLITYTVFGKKVMMSDVRSIGICMAAVMIGWQLDLPYKRFVATLLIFAIITMFTGVMQVVTNIGGFVILDQYHTDNKNALGVMLATSAFIFLYLMFNNNENRFKRTVLLLLTLLTFIVLLTIRARAATLTFFIMALYLFYERFKGKNFTKYFLIGIVVAIVIYLILPSSIKGYIHNSFFQNYEDGGDITTGRMDRNLEALSFLSDHVLIGNLRANIHVDWIHNYLLNRTFEFGLVFVMPIFLFYFTLLIKTIKYSISSNIDNNYNIGFFLLLIPYIVSLVEPTLPFGPGTVTVCNFMYLGVALRNIDNSSNSQFVKQKLK